MYNLRDVFDIFNIWYLLYGMVEILFNFFQHSLFDISKDVHKNIYSEYGIQSKTQGKLFINNVMCYIYYIFQLDLCSLLY